MAKILPYLSAIFTMFIGIAYYYDYKKANKSEKGNLKYYFILMGVLVISTFVFMLIRFLVKNK